MKQGDKEHLAFEEYAKTKGLDLTMHPLHLIYLNLETQKQLDAFKAGYKIDPFIDKFFVNAGKYEGLERNYKVSLDFTTFEEALEAYDKCKGYPWKELKYKNRIIEVSND